MRAPVGGDGSVALHSLDDIHPDSVKVVAIGSSTGAPRLLEQIISGLPADLPAPILIAQHLPPTFSESFARHLDQISALSVHHAEDGMPIYAGSVYVGRGREHLRVRACGTQLREAEVSTDPTYLVFKPSADELFRSCAAVYGPDVLAIVMSGIGRDGTEGARAVKAAGGIVVTQDQASCAVYGMPRSCFEAGFSDAQLTPDEIRQMLLKLSPRHGAAAQAG